MIPDNAIGMIAALKMNDRGTFSRALADAFIRKDCRDKDKDQAINDGNIDKSGVFHCDSRCHFRAPTNNIGSDDKLNGK